ncbi:hypothetical protein BGZ88_001931 [Linnemannia elongata]|nr:hypothetical protein BGZ88_001931 [Linnemannia elongata]
MTVDDIYNFYKTRILDNHELEILGESSRQVVSGGHELASLLQDRQKEVLPVGRKRPREQFDDDDNVQSWTPENRESPSPTPIRTESVDSPVTISTVGKEKHPFQNNEDDDEEDEEETGDDEDAEEYNTLLPDKMELDYQFVGSLDGINIADGFENLFNVVKRKKVDIKDTDQALGGDGSSEKALKKWHEPEASTIRSDVRDWLDHLEDYGYNRIKTLDHLHLNRPTDPKRQPLWTFMMSALQNFPQSDTSKVYSESTAIASFILPLCRVFLADPCKMLFLNFVDVSTLTGRFRNGARSRKEPDLALEIKDRSNKTILEVGIGEVTSHAEKTHKKKNAKDLVRIGLSLKDALDYVQDAYGVNGAILPGWQVIGNNMAIYFMFRCGNMYLLVHVKDVTIPDGLLELKELGADIKTWLELQATVEHGLRPVLDGITAGRKPMVNARSLARIATTRTPDFKSFLKRQ